MSNRERSRLICLLLALITVALYWPATGFDFINFDDTDYILNNPAIHQGVTKSALAWAFKTSYASNWHPLTWVSHMVDCGLYGSRAGGHHLTSILLHALNSALLFLVLQAMTRMTWRSAMVAALFAWHPLHVESVAWVSERKDVLSTLFWLLTMVAYVRYRGVRSAAGGIGQKEKSSAAWYWYGAALVFFALALMSKPMAVTLPFVLLLLDDWPLGNAERGARSADSREAAKPNRPASSLWNLLLEKAPFFVLAAFDCVATVWAQRGANSIVSRAALPVSDRIVNSLVNCVLYLGKMLWPADLAVLYPYVTRPMWQGALAGCLLAAISAAVILARRRAPYLGVGWFWFLGTLVPVIGLVQVGIQSIADRYTYVPSIGIFIGAVWGAAHLLDRWNWPVSARAMLAGCVLVPLIICSHVQLGYWQDSVTLFTQTTAVTRDNILAEYDLGEALGRRGDQDQAAVHYLKALAIRPSAVEAGSYNSQTEARYNLGAIYAHEGRWPEAEAQFRAIIREHPDHAQAHFALATVLLAAGRVSDAVAEFRQLTQLRPDDPQAWQQLGDALLKQGNASEATNAFRMSAHLKEPSSQQGGQ